MNIGFIGLGIMGKPMAKNLIKAGHKLTVYDIAKASVDELHAAGAATAQSAEGAARSADVVITMLPDSPQVKEIVCGENGVLSGARPGTSLVDMSSIAPAASVEISSACAKKGVKMIDAPVSGGEPKAIDATLSIMAGGDKDVFDSVKDDILLKVGASAVYCGGIGAGNTTKLVNQIIVAANIAACAEGFTLAKKSGVDPAVVFSAIKNGLAGSAVMNAKLPMMLEQNFKPGFKIDLHIKDLNNALSAGHATGSPLPLAAGVMEMFQIVRADGFGQEDHSALARYYEKLACAKIES
jgi:2-hydroxy-3-oxopropionate reductase